MTLIVGEIVHVQDPRGWQQRTEDYVVIGIESPERVALQKVADQRPGRVRDFLLGDLLVTGDPEANARVTFTSRVVPCRCR